MIYGVDVVRLNLIYDKLSGTSQQTSRGLSGHVRL